MPAIKPEREEARIFPKTHLYLRFSSEIKSLATLAIFFKQFSLIRCPLLFYHILSKMGIFLSIVISLTSALFCNIKIILFFNIQTFKYIAMEAFDFFQDFPLWVNEQIFLLGGGDLIEPNTDKFSNEVKIGIMDEDERKLFTLIFLQQEKKNLIINEIYLLQEKIRVYLEQLQSEAEKDLEDDEDFANEDREDDPDQVDPSLIETPYDNAVNDLLKSYLDLNWVQIRCVDLVSLKVGLRLNYFGDFAFTKGFEIYAVPGSNQPSKQRINNEVGKSEMGTISIDFFAN